MPEFAFFFASALTMPGAGKSASGFCFCPLDSYPPLWSMGVDMLWFPWLLPMRKAHELAFTGDNITGEGAHRLGMANYCVPDSIIDEFTGLFAMRVALMPWQMATQYKRALKKGGLCT